MVPVACAIRRRRALVARRSDHIAGSARRLDWRFLLPAVDDQPFTSLRLLSGDGTVANELMELGVARTVVLGAHGGERVDAVVSLSGSPAEMLIAVATLRPGGIFYCEIDRARLRHARWSPSRLSRRLRSAGLVTAAYWRRRQGERDTLFLPLDVPAAVPWYLRELADDRGARRRLARRVVSTILRQDGHRLATVARRYSLTGVLAAAGTSPGTPGLLATGDLATGDTVPGGDLVPGGGLVLPVLLARGEGAWSRVVLLAFGRTDRQPRDVVKLPRTPEHNQATEREQQVLTHISSLLSPDLADTIPQAKGVRTWSGLRVGTESFLPGRPLAFSAAGSPLAGSQLASAVGWLIDLHLATRMPDVPADHPSAAAILEEPLHRTAHLLHLPHGFDASLRERYGVARASGSSIPMVWQHCDLTPQNVRWDGLRHSVVDWEAARTGPALCDLYYLLLHWKWEDMPALGTAPLEVFRRVFMSKQQTPAVIASEQVRRYCIAIGVDHRLMEPLLLNMLSQQTLDRADRIRTGGDDPDDDHNMYGELCCLMLGSAGPVPAWSPT